MENDRSEPCFRLEDAECVMAKHQMRSAFAPSGCRQKPAMKRQEIFHLAAKTHDTRLRQVFCIRQRGRQPVRRVEADEPVARRDNAGAVLFQMLDTKRHGVDLDAIGIANIGPEMRYRLGDAFKVMTQGTMGNRHLRDKTYRSRW